MKDDVISRQAAIEAFLTELTKRERKNLLHTWSTVEVKYFITDMLEQLPSAQPEIVHCKDCKWWDKQDFLQGRCALLGIHPTGGWFCANADMRGEKENENNIQ